MKPTPTAKGKPAKPARAPKAPKAPDFKICPNCQTKNKAKWELCAKCGETLENVPPGYPPGAEPTDFVATPPSGGAGPAGVVTALLLLATVAAAVYFFYNQPQPVQPSTDIFVMPTLSPPYPPPSPEPTRPDDDAAGLYRQGRAALAAKRYPEAVSLLSQAVQAASDRAEYQFAYGQALMRDGQKELAQGALATAARLNPAPDYLTEHGMALEQVGRPDDAISAYESAVQKDPGWELALRRLVALHGKAGRLGEAIEYQERVRQRNVNDPVVTQELAVMLDKADRREESIAVYQELVKQVPRAAITRGLLAEALIKEGRKDEAVQVFREGIAGDANNPLLHRGLASALERDGNVAEAIVAYRRYAELAPSAPDAAQLSERANRLEKQQQDREASATASPSPGANQRLAGLQP